MTHPRSTSDLGTLEISPLNSKRENHRLCGNFNAITCSLMHPRFCGTRSTESAQELLCQRTTSVVPQSHLGLSGLQPCPQWHNVRIGALHRERYETQSRNHP